MALSDGLQGWWCPSLDTSGNGTTTLTDLSGNGNNGTLTNMDAATDWVADTDSGGVRALDFDGIDDYVAIPELSSSGDFSISFWVKPAKAGNDQFWLSYSDTGVTNGIVLRTLTQWRLWIDNNQSFLDVPTITMDAWHHVVLTRTSGSVNFYWDGIASTSNPISDSGTFLLDQIARFQNSRWASGRFDALAFYSRAITTGEISTIYSGGRSLNLLASVTTQSIVPQLLMRRRRLSGGLVI